MNELTVINGLTCYNESVSVHQAYLLFRLLLLNRCLGKVLVMVSDMNALFFKVGISVSLQKMFKARCFAGL